MQQFQYFHNSETYTMFLEFITKQNSHYKLKRPQIDPGIFLKPPNHVTKWFLTLCDVSTKTIQREWSCLASLATVSPKPEPISPHTRHPHLPLSRSNLIHVMDPARTFEAY